MFDAVTGAIEEIRAGGFAWSVEAYPEPQFGPLSSAQRRLFALAQRPGGELPYHLPQAFWIDGPLDLHRLDTAFRAVIQRHESLRTSFLMLDGEPVAKRVAEPRFEIERLDAPVSGGNALSGFAKRNFDRSCQVVSDGLACFASVTDAGCTHQAIKTGSGSASARTPAFKWVNTALGNIKASIVGTYRSINSKHVPRYLAEFEYRFNRRYDLSAMMPRLCWASVRTTPMPYRLLKLAEVYA